MAYTPTAYDPTQRKYYQAPYFQQPYSQGKANKAWEGKTEQYGDDTAFANNNIESGVNDPNTDSEAQMATRARNARATSRRAGFRKTFDDMGLNSRQLVLAGLLQ